MKFGVEEARSASSFMSPAYFAAEPKMLLDVDLHHMFVYDDVTTPFKSKYFLGLQHKVPMS